MLLGSQGASERIVDEYLSIALSVALCSNAYGMLTALDGRLNGNIVSNSVVNADSDFKTSYWDTAGLYLTRRVRTPGTKSIICDRGFSACLCINA